MLVESLNGDVLPDVFEYVGIPTYTVASTYQFTATLSHANYEGSVLCTLKVKSVDVGGTLYTIEDALNVATSGNVIVKANTAFSSVVGYYNGSQYYTVIVEVFTDENGNEYEDILWEVWVYSEAELRN